MLFRSQAAHELDFAHDHRGAFVGSIDGKLDLFQRDELVGLL